MRISTKLSLVLVALLLCFSAASAQNIGDMTFMQTTGNTYSAITGGTQLADGSTNLDDNVWTAQSIGFTFKYNNTDFTTFSVSVNAFIQLGNTIESGAYGSPLSNSNTTNAMALFGRDMYIYSGNSAELRYETIGSAPNRVLVIQWKNLSPISYSSDLFNIQLRLYETTNRIEFRYGSSTLGTTSRTCQVGIKGSNTSTYQNRSVVSGTNTWSTSTPGTAISSTCAQNQTLYPDNGLMYSWQEVPMSYSGSTVYQITGKVARGAVNQPVVALEINVPGTKDPFSLSSLSLHTNGTTNTADISNAKIYYTGNSPVFSTADQYGTTVGTPSGAFTVSGTKTLKPGLNYFWLTYDINTTSTVNNLVDGEFRSLTITPGTYVPTITAPTGNRLIADPLEGTYTVGTGGNYSNLTNLFNDASQIGLKGNVTANIISDLDEAGGAYLSQWPEVGTGKYTMTIQPSGGARTISATGAAVIWLHGADRVTFDGRLNGSGRNLTFQNNQASGAGFIFTRSELASMGGATNNTVKFCNILAGSNSSSSAYGVFMGSTTASNGIAGEENSNNTLEGNQISRAYYGLYTYKGSSDKDMESLLVKNNIFGSDIATNYIGIRGLYISALKDAKVTGNTIYNMMVSPNTNIAAIDILSTNSGNIIEGNKIYNINNPNAGGWGAYGIHIQAGSSVNVLNNFIWNLTTLNYSSGSTYNPYAIRIVGGTGHKIYNNSVHMYGIQANQGTTASLTAAMMVTTTSVTGLDIRNNIFRNTLSSTIAGTKSYAIYVPSGMTFQNIDHNVYDAGGAYGILGFFGSDKLTLPDWQASTTKDANSKTTGYSFKSDTDLHLNNGWSSLIAPVLNNATYDIDGESRRTLNTNIGADEVKPVLGIQQDLTQFTMPFCEGNNTSLSFVPMIATYGDGVSRINYTGLLSETKYTWYKDGSKVTNPNSNTFSNGTSNVFTITNMKPEDAKTYKVEAEFFGSPVLSSSNSTLVMEFPIQISQQPVGGQTCEDMMTHKLSVTATGTIFGSGNYSSAQGYQWQKEDKNNAGTYVDIPGARNADFFVDLTDPIAATGNYRVRIMGPGNCGPTQVISSNINLFVAERLENVMATVNFANPMFICNGEDVIFDALADGTILGYQWQKSTDGKVFADIEIAKNQTAQSQRLIIPKASVMETGTYRCLVYGHQNCDETIVETQPIEILVWPFFEIVEHPKSEVVCMGEEVILNVVPNGKVLESQDGYQWQKDGVNIDPKANPTAKTPILIINSANYDHSGSYRCVIHFEDCRGQLYTTTNEAQVYVLRETEFVHQPESQMSEIGGSAMFTFDAHIYDYPPQYQPDIQWYRGTTPLQESDRITGVKSSILSFKNIQSSDFGTDYSVKLVGKCGEAVSNQFALVEEVNIDVISNPQSVIECQGTDVEFQFIINITGTNNIPNYKWFKDGIELANGAKYSGTTSSVLTIIAPTPAEVGIYHCVVTVQSAPGLYISKTSDMAEYAIKLAPSFTMQPPAAMNVETGKELKLEVAALGEAPLSYQWKKDDVELTGQTNSTLTIASATTTDAGNYTCVVTNECGSVVSTACAVTIQLQGTTDVNEPETAGSMLLDVVPNPVANTGRIEFNMAEAGNAKITLNDAAGRQIAILINKFVAAGSNHIDINVGELNLSNGVYFYTINANGKSETRRFVVVK